MLPPRANNPVNRESSDTSEDADSSPRDARLTRLQLLRHILLGQFAQLATIMHGLADREARFNQTPFLRGASSEEVFGVPDSPSGCVELARFSSAYS